MKIRSLWTLACAAALGFTAGTAMAVDNTGTGGNVTYTDASGANPRPFTPWPGGYVIHTFTNSGTLTIPTAVANASVLVVAGGGGGGANGGGGGGAGGLIYSNANMSISAGSTAVTVGRGGAACIDNNYSGSSGSNSTFSTLTAVGGGGGGSRDGGKAGLNGGSGGGGGAADSSLGTKGTGTIGQGNDGGIGFGNGTTSSAAGGGGGAGGAGVNGVINKGGNGGNGVTNTITGSILVYGGGGGGGTTGAGSGSTGGIGGGGNGVVSGTAGSGDANTGGGGGGGGGSGAAGGSGIVIVRYPYDAGLLSVTVTAPANGWQFLPGSSVTATVSVANGQSPYTVTFYTNYNGGAYGPAGTASDVPYTINLGTLADGTYSFYATVTDSALSNAASATNTFTVAADTTPPTPDQMTFAVIPAARDGSTVVMTATTATDALSPPVQYYFFNTTNSNNSGWISGTVWTNTGLTRGTIYGYQVKARDAVSNETAFSTVLNAVPADAPVFWDANGTGAGRTDGAGTWLNANQWWNGTGNCDWNNGMPNDAIIGNGAAGGTITLGTVTAGSVTFTNFTGTYTLSGGSLTQNSGITVAANAGAVTIITPVDGSGGIVKNGSSSTLTLSGANSYSGGTVINAGTLIIGADGNLGNTSGGITFTGTATFQSSIATLSLPSTRTITLNNGAIATFYFNVNSNPKSITINGKITGNGGITLVDAYILGGGSSMNLNSTANDFTGSLNMGGASGNNVTTYNVASLADGAGYGNIIFGKANGSQTFNYTGSSALTLNSGGRRIELASTTAGNTFNSSGAGVITVNTDMLISGTGAKTFTLGGSNTGDNTFAGKIANGSSAVSFTKAGNGTWILSGINTYSGATSVTAGKLVGVTGGSCSNSVVTVSGGILGVSVTDNAKQWTCAGLTYSAASTTLEFAFGANTPSTTVAPLQVNGNVALTGVPTVKCTGSGLTDLPVGAYPLITWTGTMSGFATSAVTLDSGSGVLVSDDANKTLWLILSSTRSAITWQGPSLSNWNVNQSENTIWKDALLATTYYQENTISDLLIGDSVVFGTTGAGTVTLNTTVYPASVQVNTTGSYTISGSGSIGGVGSLTKSSSSTLTLSTTNSYSGGTLLSAGTLIIGANDALGTGSLVLGGGTIQSSDATARTFTNAVTLGGDFIVGGTGNLTFSDTGASALAAARTITVNSGITATFAPSFSGSVGITKAGVGTLVLSGTKTYSGGTTLSAGKLVSVGSLGSGAITWATTGTTLQFNSDSNLTAGNGWTTSGRSLTRTLVLDRLTSGDASGLTYTFSSQFLIDTGCTLTFSAGSNITSGTPTINFSNATRGLSSSDSNTTPSITLTPNGVNFRANGFSNTRGRTVVLDGTSAGNEMYGVMSDGNAALNITKSGTSTWTLSGANTYTGATTINNGKLKVATGSGTRCASAVTIANTAGCIFGVQLATAYGQWTSSSTLTVGGVNSEIDIDYGSTAPTNSLSYDPIKVTTLTVNGKGTLKILSSAPTQFKTGVSYPLINFTTSGPAAAEPYTGLALVLPTGVTGYLKTSATHVELVITTKSGTLIQVF